MMSNLNNFEHVRGCPCTVRSILNKFEYVLEARLRSYTVGTRSWGLVQGWAGSRSCTGRKGGEALGPPVDRQTHMHD